MVAVSNPQRSSTFSKLVSAVINNRIEQVKQHIIQHVEDLEQVDSAGCSAFLLASRYCGADVVAALLSGGSDPALTDKVGRNALFHAVLYNQRLLPFLLAAGVSATQRDKDGNCPLFLMAKTGNHQGLQILLDQASVDLTVQDAEGNTALLLARDLACLHCLAAYGADLNHQNQAGRTALMVATSLRDAAAVQYLVDCNADVNLLDAEGCSTLQLAIEHKHIDIIYILLNSPLIKVNHKDQKSRSMLLLALEHLGGVDPEQEIAKLLISKGADVNHQDQNGDHALLAVVRMRNYKLIDLILQHDFNPVLLSLQLLDELLHFANQRRDIPLLQRLLDYIRIVDTTSYHQVDLTDVETEQVLLSQDVNSLLLTVDSEDFQQHRTNPRLAMKRFHYIYDIFEAAGRSHEITWEGESIFLYAIQQGMLLLAIQLVHFGVDCDSSSRRDGSTALMFAAKKGWLSVVQWLVELGCNVEAVGGTQHNTALIEAAYEGHISVVQYLLACSANALAVNKIGETAADVCRRRHGPSVTSKCFFGSDPYIANCHLVVDSELDRLAVIEARALEKELFRFDEDFQSHANATEEHLSVMPHAASDQLVLPEDDDALSYVSFDFFAASEDEDPNIDEVGFIVPVSKRARR